MCELATAAATQLEAQGISTAVINPRWIKPLDTQLIEFFGRSVDVICTIEDHVLHNGFGCAVMEHLSDQRITTPVVRIGWPDQFVEHGSVDVLRKKHGSPPTPPCRRSSQCCPRKARRRRAWRNEAILSDGARRPWNAANLFTATAVNNRSFKAFDQMSLSFLNPTRGVNKWVIRVKRDLEPLTRRALNGNYFRRSLESGRRSLWRLQAAAKRLIEALGSGHAP
jgi:hypothetical protein